jgi:hypothetical protein
MRSYGRPLLLIASVGFLAACEESVVPTDTSSPLELAGKPAPTAVYDYEFEGDIVGELLNVSASPSDPFKQVNSGGLDFEFVTASGDTTACNEKHRDLTLSVNDWGGYALDPWDVQVDLSRRKRSAFHLQITGTQDDGVGSINLAVNDVPFMDENDNGLTAVIEFRDVRALVSALSYSDTLDGGGPDYDPDDRCVNFIITARKH